MTAEEKLAIIRKQAEEDFVHYSTIGHDFPGSEYCYKAHFAEEWLDFIDKVCSEDPDYAPTGYNYMDEDVVAEGRKRASGLDFSLLRGRIDIYMRGFDDGQHWRKTKENKV